MAGDHLNPIFLYEVRGIVRNRAILASLCVYLTAQIAVLGYVFFHEMTSAHGSFGVSDPPGRNLARYSLYPLFFGLYVLLPLHSAAMTIRQSFDELFHLIPLDWAQVARGKIATAALVSGLFFAVTLPFLTVAWLLRGVDILVLFLQLLLLFSSTQILNLYVASAVIRCRSVGDVISGLAGLTLASIPLGLSGLLSAPVLFIYLNYPAYSHMIIYGAIVLLSFIFAFLITLNLFHSNWDAKTHRGRFFNTAFQAWGMIILALFFISVMGIVLGLLSMLGISM